MKHFLTFLLTACLIQILSGQDWERFNTHDDYDPGEFGYYTTLNEYSPKNCPSFYDQFIKWNTEQSIFLYQNTGSFFQYSDELEKIRIMMWEFDKDLMQWRCIKDQTGADYSLGSMGVPDESNFPGVRYSKATWTDHDNNLWLFSGQPYDDEPFLLDLWKFDTSTSIWTYMNGGLAQNFQDGNYEEIGLPSSTAYPNYFNDGNNYKVSTLVDRNGDLVMFRGSGSNDMWRYHIDTNEWEWLIGEEPATNNNFYEYESPDNDSGQRGIFWTDDDNNYHFLDGRIGNSKYNIWKFDNTTLSWTNQLKEFDHVNLELFRIESEEVKMLVFYEHNTWNQNNEYLWFFGTENGIMARLNLENYQWAWFNGATQYNGENADTDEIFVGKGFAFKKGEERTINMPLARASALTWERNGKLFLGYGAEWQIRYYDIWSYDPNNYSFTFEKGRTIDYPFQFQNSDHYQYNKIDTSIYSPRPYDDEYDVGIINHNGSVYYFDDTQAVYRLNKDTGLYELLKAYQSPAAGEIGIASEEVFPHYFRILGAIGNEIYGYSIYNKRLFKFNIESNLYTLIQEFDDYETGSLGEFNEFNFPRLITSNYKSWVGPDQNIYLFFNNELWCFNPMLNQWAILNNLPWDNQLVPKYYVESSKFNSWIDNESNLWVFNYSMWKYDVLENTWELVKHGMPKVNTSSNGTLGDFSIFNNPSQRVKFINWTDDQGRFWMAHGRAIYESTLFGYALEDKRVFQDIWMFDPIVKNWVWISGPTDPISRDSSLFQQYDFEQPVMNVSPLSTSDEYLYHNSVEYNEGKTVSVFENCIGSMWKMDYTNIIPSYNVVHGTAQYDNEEDGCDTLDQPFVNLQVIVDDFNAFTFTDSIGEYAQFCNESACEVIANYGEPESEYFTITPMDTLINFNGFDQSINLDYCVSPNGEFNDLEVVMIPQGIPQAGFASDYTIQYRNKGTTTMSGSVKLIYSTEEVRFPMFDIDTIGPAGDFSFIDTLEWDFLDIEPFEAREIDVAFSIAPANTGDTISYNLELCLDTLITDFMPNDNSFILNEIVVSSFDPNDKQILEGTVLPLDKIDDFIHYKIRFENTGSANARFIYLEDYISEEYFDVSTLIPVSASHEYTARVEEGNKLFVMFDNINLPFDPEDGNMGYFVFKIKTNANLEAGDVIRNSVSIYFDYNDPIFTEESLASFGILDFDSDGYTGAEDCDDTNPNVNPGEVEVPYNGLDDDCNLETLDDDLDQDGFLLIDDCDDNDIAINPNAEEIPNNGIDEDCDGTDLIVSLHEFGNSSVNIYPNPFDEVIYIDVKGSLNFKATLLSSESKFISSSKNKSIIETTNLVQGTYLLEIQDLDSGKKIIERIIKN